MMIATGSLEIETGSMIESTLATVLITLNAAVLVSSTESKTKN
jgi:hypothetical protein